MVGLTMKNLNKNINAVADKISNLIISGIIIVALLYFIIKVWYPYAIGDFKMKTDYYEQSK